jgi:hypothetical protein
MHMQRLQIQKETPFLRATTKLLMLVNRKKHNRVADSPKTRAHSELFRRHKGQLIVAMRLGFKPPLTFQPKYFQVIPPQ